MARKQGFEAYDERIEALTHIIALRRRSYKLQDREARLRAACESATLSLERDLEALVELEKSFSLAGVPTSPTALP